MDEYIKREPILQIAKKLQGEAFGSPIIVAAIENAPAENVVELNKVEPCVDIMERWIEIEDGAYPDGFPKTKYKHGSCESVERAYPFCPYCGKKITHIKTLYKEFDFVWKDRFIVE